MVYFYGNIAFVNLCYVVSSGIHFFNSFYILNFFSYYFTRSTGEIFVLIIYSLFLTNFHRFCCKFVPYNCLVCFTFYMIFCFLCKHLITKKNQQCCCNRCCSCRRWLRETVVFFLHWCTGILTMLHILICQFYCINSLLEHYIYKPHCYHGAEGKFIFCFW